MGILVTGGAGFIGSHIVKYLSARGERVVVLDNLSRGHRSAVDPRAVLLVGDVADRIFLEETLRSHQISSVLHLAAFSEIGESLTEPEMYYRNNFLNTLTLLQAMSVAKVSNLVFASTAAVYGHCTDWQVKEDRMMAATHPYGRSKMMAEMAIADFAEAHQISYAILRLFNAAGAIHDASLGERHQPETHLIPLALRAAATHAPFFLYGNDYATQDGTCVRDYIHVTDIVAAHWQCLQSMRQEKLRQTFNVGSGDGASVLQVLKATESTVGAKIDLKLHPRRMGDPAYLVASTSKIKKHLNWSPKFSNIETIVSDAWRWHCKAQFTQNDSRSFVYSAI